MDIEEKIDPSVVDMLFENGVRYFAFKIIRTHCFLFHVFFNFKPTIYHKSISHKYRKLLNDFLSSVF